MMRKQLLTHKRVAETEIGTCCTRYLEYLFVKKNNPDRFPNIASWLADGLLVLAGMPIIAAVIFAVMRAYRTYHPARLPLRKAPEDFGLRARRVTIPTTSPRVSLQAWQCFRNATRPTVIIGHGIGQHKGFALPYAAFLYRAGYNVLTFDHRNHGKSDPDRVLWNKSGRFTDDVYAAIRFVRNQPGCDKSPIALLTFSFSTFPALYVLKRWDCPVDAIICDSGPALDVKVLPERFIDAGKATLPRIFKGPILFGIVKKIYRWTINAMLGVQWPPDFRSFNGRLLLIANEEDIVIPPDEVRGIADLYPRSEFWVAPTTGHLMALRRRGQEYSTLVLEFLGRAFAESARTSK